MCSLLLLLRHASLFPCILNTLYFLTGGITFATSCLSVKVVVKIGQDVVVVKGWWCRSKGWWWCKGSGGGARGGGGCGDGSGVVVKG